MDPEYARARAAQAESELRETEAAFEQARAGLLEIIATSKIGETEFREKCFFAIQGLEAARNLLVALASSKSIADHDDLIRKILAGKDAV